MELTGSVLRAAACARTTVSGEALVRAVDEVTLEVAAGESVAVVGPSGCGKSTLLYLLGGLERPTGGSVWLGGEQIDRMPEARLARLRRHAVGFVFQAFHLVDELTTLENVELPALLAGQSPGAARHRAADMLEQVGLSDRGAICRLRFPVGSVRGSRSRGRWRTSRLIVFADEPTGNLDSAATNDVLRLFDQLHVNGQTLVIVTHDERIAATADRLISMRDGTFVDETRLTGGTAQLVERDTGLEA